MEKWQQHEQVANAFGIKWDYFNPAVYETVTVDQAYEVLYGICYMFPQCDGASVISSKCETLSNWEMGKNGKDC